MKTKITILTLLLSITVITVNAQVRLTNNGYVSVGSTDPAIAPLDIRGHHYPLRFSNSANGSQTWELQPYIYNVSNAGFSIRSITENTDRLVINSLGYIGMGNSNPSSPLEVKSGNLWNGTIRANSHEPNQYSSFALLAGNNLSWAIYNHPGNSHRLYFANSKGEDKISFTQGGTVYLHSKNTSDRWNILSLVPDKLVSANFPGLGPLNIEFGEIGSSSSRLVLRYNGQVDNAVYAKSFDLLSDENLKENINDIGFSNAVDVINSLRGVSFYWKAQSYSNDTTIDNNNPLFGTQKDYGFISQEVAEILPEIVTEIDGKNYMNYAAIIPFLVEAYKYQQEQIEQLSGRLTNCCGEFLMNDTTSLEARPGSDGNTNDPLMLKFNEPFIQKAKLFQNTPNPFFQQTEIKYYIPKEARQADLYLYNMMGNQIRSFRISGREDGKQTIYSSELSPGMYIYTLIIDGKEVDSKRMILTD